MQPTTATDTAPRDLFTVEQFAAKHIAWSPAALRALILNARDRLNSRGEKVGGNGLDVALVHLGRRVLLDEQRFFVWIAAQQKRHRAT